jgi:hypothetical protein
MSIFTIGLKLGGAAAVGAAAAIGWKLGNFLVDTIVENKEEIKAQITGCVDKARETCEGFMEKARETCDEAVGRIKTIATEPAKEPATEEAGAGVPADVAPTV